MRARLAYLREGPSRGSSADPRLSELTARAVAIDLPCTHVEILEALYRIWRDIDLAFGFSPGTTPPDLAELKREFGKLVLSSLRWMRHYGLDPADCLDAAETAQRAYTPPPAADRPRVAEDGVAYLTDTGRYVIADQGGWVTGSYATEAAARLAVSSTTSSSSSSATASTARQDAASPSPTYAPSSTTNQTTRGRPTRHERTR